MNKNYLREATIDDMLLLYHWANDTEVRNNSFQTHSINIEEHKSWFRNKIESANCSIYIYMVNDLPVGQIRLDYEGNRATIDYSIDKKYRGQGHGSMMLVLAEKEIYYTRKKIQYFDAEVKMDNIASRKKFEKLGYKSMEFIKYSKRIGEDNHSEILGGGEIEKDF